MNTHILMLTRIILLGFCLLKEYSFAWSLNGSWEAALQDKLLTNRHIVRPADVDESVPIQLFLNLIYLKEINTAQQLFSVIATFMVVWQDDSLQWNPADYDGAMFISLPASKVWTPTFTIFNSAENSELLGQMKTVTVASTGLVKANDFVRFTTICEMDATLFPFDTQTCEIMITGSANTALQENYTAMAINLDYFFTSTEWELLNTEILNIYPFPYSFSEFSFVFKRRADFFVATMIIPLIILSFLGLLVFPLPAESGEKVSFGITCFLSFFILQSSITKYLPSNFSRMPYIVAMLLVMMLMNALFLTMTVTSVRIVFKKPFEKLPSRLKKMVTRSNKIGNSKNSSNPEVTSSVHIVDLEYQSHTELRSSEIEKGSVDITNRIYESPKYTTQVQDEGDWSKGTDRVNMILFWIFTLVLIIMTLGIMIAMATS